MDLKSLVKMRKVLCQAMFGFNHQLCRSGGRWRAQIGDKVGNGEIRLMANGRDHRNRRTENGSRQRFIVERSQVFNGAAAARDDNHVHGFGAVEMPDARRNFLSRRFALHLRGINLYANIFMATGQNVEHVLQGCAARRSYQPNAPRQRRNGLAARCVKQTFLGETRFELLKCHLQRTSAHGLQEFRGELQLTARVIDRHAATGNHLHAGFRTKTQQSRLAAEHYDAQLRVAIF